MKKLTAVTLFLVLLVAVIGGTYIWYWLPAQSAKAAPFRSVNGSWLGIRPLETGVLMSYYQQSQAQSQNEFVSANMTATVFSINTDSDGDEISVRANLHARKLASNNAESIDLQALKVRINDDNDTRASVSFDRNYSSGQNIDLQKMEVANAWLDKEASAKVPVVAGTINNSRNASFAITFTWRLYEYGSERNTAHSLNITGAVYYHEPTVLGLANTWFIETSIELDLIPGHQLSECDFDGGSLAGWSVGDNNPSSGLNYWGVTERDHFTGPFSVWCAGDGYGTPNTDLYSNGMDAYMKRDFNFSGFGRVYLYFKAWIETQEEHDYFYVEYYDSGSWKTAASYSGPMSTSPDLVGVTWYDGWLGAMLELPASASQLQFRFYSDESVVYRGVYLDSIVLLGSA